MIFIIRPHSFVDVITNSSSELFVMRTEKSMDLIMQVLKQELEDETNGISDYISSIFTIESFDQADLNVNRSLKYLKDDLKIGDIIIVGQDTGDGYPQIDDKVRKILKSRFNLFKETR